MANPRHNPTNWGIDMGASDELMQMEEQEARRILRKFRETKYPHKRSEGLRRTGKQKKLDRLMFETGEKR